MKVPDWFGYKLMYVRIQMHAQAHTYEHLHTNTKKEQKLHDHTTQHLGPISRRELRKVCVCVRLCVCVCVGGVIRSSLCQREQERDRVSEDPKPILNPSLIPTENSTTTES